MFCRDGIHATGVDRILAAADASKMTLYARFGSKESLVREALRREGETWRAAFFAVVRGAADEPAGRLRAIVPGLAGWFRGGRFHGCAFINVVAEHRKGEAGAAAPDDLAAEVAVLVDGTVTGLMVSGDEAVLRTASRMLEALLRAGLPGGTLPGAAG